MPKRVAQAAGLEDDDVPSRTSVVASTPPSDRIQSMPATSSNSSLMTPLSPLPLPPQLPPLEVSILLNDDDDRITSNTGSSLGSLSLASKPAVDEVILIMIVEPGRVENKIVASYRSRAEQLGLLDGWTLASKCPSTPVLLSKTATRPFMHTLSLLTTAHPLISKRCARDFIGRFEPMSYARTACFPYTFALAPQPDKPVRIAAMVWMHLDE